MTSPQRFAPRAALLGLAFTLAGCAAATSTHAFLEPAANLNAYQRYAWGPADKTGTGDPRLDNNEIFASKVEAAVDRQMAAKGFRKSSPPQLLVRMHASVEQRIDLSEGREPFLSRRCADPAPAAANAGAVDPCKPFIYDAGTLVIDLVDARTNQLVWRGWSEGNIDGIIDSQKWLDERMDKAVTRMFEQLPGRLR